MKRNAQKRTPRRAKRNLFGTESPPRTPMSQSSRRTFVLSPGSIGSRDSVTTQYVARDLNRFNYTNTYLGFSSDEKFSSFDYIVLHVDNNPEITFIGGLLNEESILMSDDPDYFNQIVNELIFIPAGSFA